MGNKFKLCERNCGVRIDISKEKYVLLGTYTGEKATQEVYFHFKCWALHFEERARQKAQAVMQGMTKKMIPIARELIEKIRH